MIELDSYRDIHSNTSAIENYLERVKNSNMSERQKKKINNFVKDLLLGKAGKKVGRRRLKSYLQHIFILHKYFKEDIDRCEKKYEKLYEDLMYDKVKKINGMPYKNSSKDEIVKTLKRYIGWIWGNDSKKYHTYLRWMKDTYKGSEKKAISLEECRKLVKHFEDKDNIRNACLIIFSFDCGGRIEEILNVRIKDLIPLTTRKGEFKVHLRGTKTELADRKVTLSLCNSQLKKWLEKHPTKKGEDYLFPLKYDNVRKFLRLSSQEVLGFRLTPHELRHSSATHFIQYGKYGVNNIMQFYYRYGWKNGSKEAETYIKRYVYENDETAQEVIDNVRQNDYTKIQENQEKLKKDLESYKKVSMGISIEVLYLIEKFLKNPIQTKKKIKGSEELKNLRKFVKGVNMLKDKGKDMDKYMIKIN